MRPGSMVLPDPPAHCSSGGIPVFKRSILATLPSLSTMTLPRTLTESHLAFPATSCICVPLLLALGIPDLTLASLLFLSVKEHACLQLNHSNQTLLALRF
mmetsp:Transcript_23698/g.42700  ORF Transcript_23698/g.42700 Transcript_23698/m.42700 type:complete len:100 (+) Transcript_23698:299-598(+)